jgi:hypothetical protein
MLLRAAKHPHHHLQQRDNRTSLNFIATYRSLKIETSMNATL